MDKQQIYQRIEDYLQGNLSAEENEAFQKELKSNEDLRNELKLHKLIHEDLSADVLNLKEKISDIHLSESIKSNKRNSKIIRLVLRYSSIAAILILAIVFLPNILKSDLNPEAIYNDNYAAYEMALNQRSDTGIEENNLLNNGIQNYLDEEYDQALVTFQTLYEIEKNDIYLLYAGNAAQALEDYNNAIQFYDDIITNENKQLIEQAKWYKALSLIKLNNLEEAISLFQSLGDDHYRNKEIKSILKNLN
jgi:tetratricopeptide (TPR) repeat protein